MSTMVMEKVEIELPKDIIFAMREVKDSSIDIKKKLKIALAVFLFQERSISLGKAVELAGINRNRLMELLKGHHLPAYEYSEKDFEKDTEIVNKSHS